MTLDELCDKQQSCKTLSIGTTKFYQLLNEKKLQAVKIGKKTMVRQSELQRYIDSLQPYKPENAGA